MPSPPPSLLQPSCHAGCRSFACTGPAVTGKRTHFPSGLVTAMRWGAATGVNATVIAVVPVSRHFRQRARLAALALRRLPLGMLVAVTDHVGHTGQVDLLALGIDGGHACRTTGSDLLCHLAVSLAPVALPVLHLPLMGALPPILRGDGGRYPWRLSSLLLGPMRPRRRDEAWAPLFRSSQHYHPYKHRGRRQRRHEY